MSVFSSWHTKGTHVIQNNSEVWILLGNSRLSFCVIVTQTRALIFQYFLVIADEQMKKIREFFKYSFQNHCTVLLFSLLNKFLWTDIIWFKRKMKFWRYQKKNSRTELVSREKLVQLALGKVNQNVLLFQIINFFERI